MDFFRSFKPIASRSPISEAMEAAQQAKQDPKSLDVLNTVTALPDEQRALVADLLRALPDLTAPDTQGRQWDKGTVTRTRLEEFIDDPYAILALQDAMGLFSLSAEQLATVGRAVFIPELDEEVPRQRNFGTERG